MWVPTPILKNKIVFKFFPENTCKIHFLQLKMFLRPLSMQVFAIFPKFSPPRLNTQAQDPN